MSAADTAIAEALAAGEAAQRRVGDGDGTTTASGGGDAGGDDDDPMQTTPPKQRKKRCGPCVTRARWALQNPDLSAEELIPWVHSGSC